MKYKLKLRTVAIKPLEASSNTSAMIALYHWLRTQFAGDIVKMYFQAFVSTSGYRIRSEPLVKRGLSDPDDPRFVLFKTQTFMILKD